MFNPCQNNIRDYNNSTGTKGGLSSVFISLLIFIVLAGIGGLFTDRDFNAQAFAVFIALSMASVYLSFRFPKVLSFHRISLSMTAIAVLVAAAIKLGPFGSGSDHLAPYMAYDLSGRFIFIIFLCLLLPIIEEIYFRGLLYPIISRYFGYRAGALITVTLFTLCHCPSLNEVLLIALSGAFYTWLVHRTGSVIPGILAHSTGNCLWLIIALKFP